MRDLEVRQIIRMRDALLEILQGGRALTRGNLAREVMQRRVFQSLSADSVYGLVGLAVRIYESEFYRDPSTGRVSLTSKALAVGAPLVGAQRAGTTHAAMVAEAMEEKSLSTD